MRRPPRSRAWPRNWPAMNPLADVGETPLVVGVEERVLSLRERLMRVHPEPFSPKIGFGMSIGVVARLPGQLLDHESVGDRVIRHRERVGVLHVDLVLRQALVVHVLDRDPHGLERLDRVVPQVARGIHRRHHLK